MSQSKSATRKPHGAFFSFLLPVAICAAIAVAFELFADCRLIRIEDAYTWRILSGGYGSPDWRVLEMNPLLAQLLALLFRVAPSAPWYGLTLLVLLCGGCAALIGMTARKRGGLLPALLAVLPVCALLNHSVISTTVCAVSVCAGFLQMQEGLRERGERRGALVAGLCLFLAGAALNLYFAAVLSACLTVCLLPCSIRDSRFKALLKGVPLAAVLLAALFGYQTLMFSSPDLTEYRANYTLYEKLQHSDLPAESDRLLHLYGTADYSSEEEAHAHADEEADDHAGETAEEHAAHIHAEEAPEATDEERNGIFGSVGLTLNDSQLFFTRVSADTELTSAEHLAALDGVANYVDTDPAHLFSALLATLKKPQFLILIALFVISALMVLLSSRGRGLTALLAAAVAFGAHIFLVMCNYDAFCYIAPFYLAAIAVMLFTIDGGDVHAAYARLLPDGRMRGVVSLLLCVCLLGGCGGLVVYSMTHPTNGYGVIEQENAYLSAYISESALSDSPSLFIGDNPADRYKYRVLEDAPARGSLSTLLAGGYDLYSPRRAAMLEKFQTENPLADCASREDILYISMGFLQNKLDRITETSGEMYFLTEPMISSDVGGSEIYKIEAVPYGVYNQHVLDKMLEQYNALQALIDAGDPEAIAYQKGAVLDVLADALGHAETELNIATVGGDEAAIAEAQAAFDSVKAEYDTALAEYDAAQEALKAGTAEPAPSAATSAAPPPEPSATTPAEPSPSPAAETK